MKIILKDEVTSLGTIGDIVNVKRGYARNYLIPQGKAVVATTGNLNQHEAEKVSWEKKLNALMKDAESLKSKLEGATVSFERKASHSEDNKLFGSVTTMDIEAALNEQGFEVDRRKFVIDGAIKTVGEHTIKVKLHKDILAEVKVIVSRLIDEEEAKAIAEAQAADKAAVDKAAAPAATTEEAATEEAATEEAAPATEEAASTEEETVAPSEEAPSEEATEEEK